MVKRQEKGMLSVRVVAQEKEKEGTFIAAKKNNSCSIKQADDTWKTILPVIITRCFCTS